MRRSLLKRPSPGLVLACVALFVALGGGAWAATSDTKTDKKIAKKAAKSYFNGHIGGASVSHANTAGSATNATNATNAANATQAGGMTVKSIYLKAPEGTGATTILDLDGLQLIAACSGSGAASLTAKSTVNDADARTMFGTTAGSVVDITGSSNFDSGSTFDAMAGAPRGTGELVDMKTGGGSVTVDFGVDDATSLGSFAGCVFGGVAFGN